jgi:hypothetical protein
VSYISRGGYHGADYLSIPRAKRPELVAALRAQGMSTRGIAEAANVSQGTVRNALAGEQNYSPGRITGTDGKTYAPARQRPAITDAEVIEGEIVTGPPRMSRGDAAQLIRNADDATPDLERARQATYVRTLVNSMRKNLLHWSCAVSRASGAEFQIS